MMPILDHAVMAWGKLNLYLHFVLFLNIQMIQIDKINLQ